MKPDHSCQRLAVWEEEEEEYFLQLRESKVKVTDRMWESLALSIERN
jgi:hypothetical protein